MANAPQDLLDLRAAILVATGLGANDVGIVADPRHKASGGYHSGRSDLAAIGRLGTDYSDRLPRDRRGLTEDASAMDIGDNWPRGGRAAWIRFANLLVHQLQAGDQSLASIRGVNFSPDGNARKRWDREHPHAGPNGDGVVDSTDDVDIHTHIEWYRDTAGQRQPAVQRLMEIISAAINNQPLGGSRDMALDDKVQLLKLDANGILVPDVQVSLDRALGLIAFNAWQAATVGDQTLAVLKEIRDLLKTPTLTDDQLNALADQVAAKLAPATGSSVIDPP